jgi:DNA-directed RNA polymerase subunit N (RpoN/RPB10)
MAFQYPVVSEICTCHDKWGVPTHLADRQEEFEDLTVIRGMTPGQALKQMDVKRMCCRSGILNPPKFFFGFSSSSRFRDETKQEEHLSTDFQVLNRSKRIIVRGGAKILPIRPLPELPILKTSNAKPSLESVSKNTQ